MSELNCHSLKEVSVIIMAGGKGARLLPYTKILPKPLIPIGEVPIIERIINSMTAYEISEFWVTLNYKKEMIKSYFDDLKPSYSIKYVEEKKPLGTAGSLRLIKKEFDQPVIVTNCDILVKADYSQIYNHHKASGNKLTIVSVLKKMTIPYGVLNTDADGILKSLDEKPMQAFLVNTGMYVIEPEMFKLIPVNTFFHMTELVELMLAKGYQIGTYSVAEEAFLDMGELEAMKRMEKQIFK